MLATNDYIIYYSTGMRNFEGQKKGGNLQYLHLLKRGDGLRGLDVVRSRYVNLIRTAKPL